MAVTWRSSTAGFERASVGPVQMVVGWGSRRDDKYTADCADLGIKLRGLESMEEAKAAIVDRVRACLLEMMNVVDG